MSHDLVKVAERPRGFTALCQCGWNYTSGYQANVTDAHANHQHDAAAEALTCPNGCYLGYEAHGETVSRAVRHEVGAVVLLRCPDCRIAWHPYGDGVDWQAANDLLAVANFGIAS